MSILVIPSDKSAILIMVELVGSDPGGWQCEGIGPGTEQYSHRTNDLRYHLHRGRTVGRQGPHRFLRASPRESCRQRHERPWYGSPGRVERSS